MKGALARLDSMSGLSLFLPPDTQISLRINKDSTVTSHSVFPFGFRRGVKSHVLFRPEPACFKHSQ